MVRAVAPVGNLAGAPEAGRAGLFDPAGKYGAGGRQIFIR